MNTSTPNPESNLHSRPTNWKVWLERLGPLLALVVVTVGFAVADQVWGRGRFIEFRNMRVVLTTTAPVAVAALGMTLIIMTGGIDLSAGTSSVLCATVLALALNAKLPVGLAILMAIGTGAACGAMNGLLIGTLRIAPFIVTLGSMTIFLGIGKHLAGSTTVFVGPELVPEWLGKFVSTAPPHWLGWFSQHSAGRIRRAVDRYSGCCDPVVNCLWPPLESVGSNEATARLCGVNILKTKLAVYALAGALFGVTGIYSFAQLRMASPTEGIGKELQYIAAVVIGGGSLSGGRGTVVGTLAGATIMGVIFSGCAQLGVSNATQDIMIGVIIVAAVTLDQLRQNSARR